MPLLLSLVAESWDFKTLFIFFAFTTHIISYLHRLPINSTRLHTARVTIQLLSRLIKRDCLCLSRRTSGWIFFFSRSDGWGYDVSDLASAALGWFWVSLKQNWASGRRIVDSQVFLGGRHIGPWLFLESWPSDNRSNSSVHLLLVEIFHFRLQNCPIFLEAALFAAFRQISYDSIFLAWLYRFEWVRGIF